MLRPFRGLAVIALALVPLAGAARPAPRSVVPFVQDDYGRALALARSRGLPLFIESWAPW